MFLLSTFYTHVSLLLGLEKNENLRREDNIVDFFKFYNLMNHKNNKTYFAKFFRKFRLGFTSNFLYLYLLYYISKKNKIIKPGDFTSFFWAIYFLNQCLLVKVFKPFYELDFYSKSKNYSVIYICEDYLKMLNKKRLSFNVKIEKAKNNYKPLGVLAFTSKTFKPLKQSIIKYSSSSIAKFINGDTSYSVYFLRKNKSFNKGRYSRNRQNYRTGVYWCLYVNATALFGLYFLFYRFTFNFGYLWWLFYCLPASFVVSHAIRNRLYNPTILYNTICGYFNFIYNNLNIIFFNGK